MTNVSDGKAFYQKFCNPLSPGAGADEDSADSPMDAQSAAVRLPGYPTPILMSNDSTVTAYYLSGEGYEDVAVLYVNGFQPQLPPIFQKTVDRFIAMCKEDGKNKIIIDLQLNGGGYIFQGFDMYRQFFPTVEQDGFNRWRENPQFNAAAEIISDAVANLNPLTSDNEDLINYWESWWNYRYDLNETDHHFESFAAKFAPRIFKGDPHTANMKWDFTDKLTTTNETFGMGMEITGYGGRANLTQPFPATHIIMLTDGYCASTCSLFQSAMKWQGNVRSVVFGGRPNRNQMNTVGGVKGAQVLSFYSVYNATRELVRLNGNITRVSAAQAAAINKLSLLPFNRSTSARINVRDAILRQNLKDGTPAQFVFEPADCRLFFTLDMHMDVSNMWKAAADSAWKGKPCVSGAGFTEVINKRSPAEEAQLKKLAKRAAQRATVTVTVKDIPKEQASFDWERIRQRYNQKVKIF